MTPPVDPDDLAQAERVLGWAWTGNGFRARVPRTDLAQGLLVLLGLTTLGSAPLVWIRPDLLPWVLAGLFCVFTVLRFGLGRPVEALGEDPDMAVPVEVGVDGESLWVAGRRWSLVDVDVDFADGTLEIQTATERWTAGVARSARRAVAFVLVPWIRHAATQARAELAARDQAEKAARDATAALRRVPGPKGLRG